MDIPILTDYPASFFNGKRVLVRVDYNVPLYEKGGRWLVADDYRLRSSFDTLGYLVSARARIILLSHLDNPRGKFQARLSLAPAAQKLNELSFGLIGYKGKVKFCPKVVGKGVHRWARNLEKGEIMLLENVRFRSGEEENSLVLAKKWAKLGEFYVNEAFSCSHRRHASIIRLPQVLPHAAGIDFEKNVEILGDVRRHPQRPVVLVLGGVKKDKIDYARKMAGWVDKVLVGGRIVQSPKLKIQGQGKIILGKLRKDGQDISKETIKQFSGEIRKAGTVIFAGPIGNTTAGVFWGTKKLFMAAIESGAFILAGGGDTQDALTKLRLADKISYISSGGGAMLMFLGEGTLPGIEALRN